LVTAASGIPETQPLNFSQLLAQIAAGPPDERLTLSEFSALLRDRAWGGLLLTFALINILPLPPGTTVVTGIPLIILTAQMAMGRATPWFPRRFDERGVAKGDIARLVAKMLPWERRIERVFKPRLVPLTKHRAARAIGAVSLLLSLILWLPIPLGNHAPAATMALFALALIYRDGLLVILGGVATLISLALVSFTIGAVGMAALLLLRQLPFG
jgi:hypothetical protein